MGERMIKSGGVEICAESFGDEKDPCLLLIMGASASMVWWDAEFCRLLAGRGLRVIRYDNRDTGRSSCCPPGKPDYTVMDMAADAFAVLDAYGVGAANLAGMSLGGMIAQVAAMQSPARVLSLSLIATGVWDDIPGLPGIDPKILQYHSAAASLDWSDKAAVIDYMAGGWRLLCGPGRVFDEAGARAMAEAEFARARCLPSIFNHALLKGGEHLYGKTAAIKIPALVVHGTHDPVLPYPHAEALLRALPVARLLRLEGAGHELHRRDWPAIAAAITDLVTAARGADRGR